MNSPHQHSSSSRSRRRARRIGLAAAALLIVAAGAAAALWMGQPHRTASTTKTPGSTSIEVKTKPTGAAIALDGQALAAKTNATISTTPGRHTVILTLRCYDTQQIMVDARPGATASIMHTFTISGRTVVAPPDKNCQARSTYQAGELKTYHSTQYNFSIAYPKDWTVQTDSKGIPHFYNKANTDKLNAGGESQESLTILVLDNPNRLSPDAWYKARAEYGQEDQSQIKQESITVNGRPAYRYETPYGFVPYLNTVLTRGDKAYLVQQYASSPDRTIYDQIVQTFSLP